MTGLEAADREEREEQGKGKDEKSRKEGGIQFKRSKNLLLWLMILVGCQLGPSSETCHRNEIGVIIYQEVGDKATTGEKGGRGRGREFAV
eukprot:316196-Hanusia_phi.AAC.2